MFLGSAVSMVILKIVWHVSKTRTKSKCVRTQILKCVTLKRMNTFDPFCMTRIWRTSFARLLTRPYHLNDQRRSRRWTQPLSWLDQGQPHGEVHQQGMAEQFHADNGRPTLVQQAETLCGPEHAANEDHGEVESHMASYTSATHKQNRAAAFNAERSLSDKRAGRQASVELL